MHRCRELAHAWSPRIARGLQVLFLVTPLRCGSATAAADPPFEPASDSEVLAYVPAGATHTSLPQRAQAAARIDVALPLAQFYISHARNT